MSGTTDPPTRGTGPSRPVRAVLARVDAGVVALALVAYVPLLLTKPGKVGADTKTYLYLDPGRLLSRAAEMWDPNVGMGTVTHQNIGYLWPMGPYYFLMDAIGLPDWVAQRLWLGTIILAAGLGVRWMLRELRWDGGGVTVAAFAYALSPYLLDYAARISVILLPFAGLPWLIGLAARSMRRGGWRDPAVFALVTLTVGGVNATSLILVMLGPLLWFLHACLVAKEVTVADAVRAALRIGVLTAVTSLWWIAGLLIQGSHGIPILRYTETYETVAAAALAPELLRGLGYWFFYGRDGLGAWTASSITLVESVPALALSYVLPGLGFVAAVLTRFRHRVFFAGIVVVGLVVAVGSHPWDSPSPYGALFKAWSRSDLGLSFRSTPRAVPLIALGLAVFLGAGVAALARRRPAWHRPAAVLLVLLICANQAALFRGQMVDRNLLRDEDLPEYRLEATEALDDGAPDTRVLEFPGIDFAAYRWGNTVDPVTPGLTDRPYVARELIPYGSPPSADLLNELDAPYQAGRPDPDALAPLARIMGIGDIMFRADLQFERYLTPRPRQTYQQLLAADGLGDPVGFGDPVPNEPVEELPLDDELSYITPTDAPDPPPVVLFPVEQPRPILRTLSARAPVVMAGDGAGVVSLASSGGLQEDRPLFYAASFAEEPDQLDRVVDEPGAGLVVTDTNRRQARRWGSVRENDGYTERAGEEPLVEDNSDNRLEVFPDATDDHRTVAEQVGGATVAASDYGNGVTYTPGDRAVNALDGDESTAWRVAAFEEAVGEFLQVDLDEPVRTDRVTLRQGTGRKNRWMTEVSLTFDGGEPVRVALDDSSRTAPGQLITFPEREFSTLRVTVEATDRGQLATYRGVSDVGIAELDIPGVDPVREIVRPPIALLEQLGDESLQRELTYVFSRRAPNPGDVIVADEEPTMLRWVDAPVARDFTPFGKARISADTPDEVVDRIVGIPDAESGGVTATSSTRLPGTVSSRASRAVDGDPATAYRTPINQPLGATVEYTYPGPVTVQDLPIEFVNDGRHSVPTAVSLSVDGGPPVQIPVAGAAVDPDGERGDTTEVRLDTGTLTGTTFRLTVDEVDEAGSQDWFGSGRIVLPVGIAELGLPTVEPPAENAPLDDRCRDDLLSLDGEPVPLRLVGTAGAAEAGELLRLESCERAVEVPAGRSLLSSGDPRETWVDVELVALTSSAGGGPGPDTLADPPGPGPAGPSTSTVEEDRLRYRVEVSDAADPYWVVLGQSWGPGWEAQVRGGESLGEPTLVNGFANGWYVDPAVHGADAVVEITWTPQRWVWSGLAASAVGVFVCLVLALRRPRARRDAVLAEPLVPRAVPLGVVDGPAVSAPMVALGAAVAAALSFLAAGPLVGVGVGVAAAAALGTRWGPPVVRGAAVALFGAAAGFIVVKQLRNDYQLDFSWVEWFETSHAWGLAATLLLALSVVVDGVRSAGARSEAAEGSVQPDGAGSGSQSA